MMKWRCSTCHWVYDPEQGDPENNVNPGTSFENLFDDWVCPICGSGVGLFESLGWMQGAQLDQDKLILDDQAQRLVSFGRNIYKERFESLFRVARKLTSSLNISEILELIRDEARAIIPKLQEVCILVIDPEAHNYTRPLHCAVEKQRINCQLCKRGRGTVSSTLEQRSSAVCFLPGQSESHVTLTDGETSSFTEIVFPICEGDEPLAVLDAIAKPGSGGLSESDFVLLKDLVDLASNVIKNARNHWKMSQEKLTVDKILQHLRPFVPSTVQMIVDRNPSDPDLDKKDIDVTVLFLDVAGYTRISETQSRDKVTFIIEKYFSSFLDIICGHGGDVNETAGDGLMVIFQGQPEENALSAVKAALAIRNKTLDINEELRNRFQPVEVNMGINSGTAAVGMNRFTGTSGTRMTFTATGPVTNLAARIASAARHGDILVGPETAQRVDSQVNLFDKGLMSFKNVSEPVHVFSLVWDSQDDEEDGPG